MIKREPAFPFDSSNKENFTETFARKIPPFKVELVHN